VTYPEWLQRLVDELEGSGYTLNPNFVHLVITLSRPRASEPLTWRQPRLQVGVGVGELQWSR
jgi:hypothetical protein